jgi:hypothetical protein
MKRGEIPPGFEEMMRFGFLEALLGRRSRRFFMGAEIPDGVFAGIYAPHLSNYAGAAGGRPFPSSAGLHTSNTFFTDDDGVYLLDVRDAPAFDERKTDGSLDLKNLLDALEGCVKKLKGHRLKIPREPPYTEAHNTWVVNHPGTLLVMPVGDLAQHVLLNLCYMLQNGFVLTDDINGRSVPWIEKFRNIVDVSKVWPLTFVDQ